MPPPASPQQQQEASAGHEALAWQLPEGWRQLPAKGMRFATILIGPEDDALELSVIPLGRGAAAVLPNLNRWRAQLGLGPITEQEMPDHVVSITTAGTTAAVVDLAEDLEEVDDDPDLRRAMLAAILPGQQRVWFFKVTGPAPVLAREKPGFMSLLQSARFVDAARPAAPAPDAMPPPAAAAAASVTWTTPPGWTADPNVQPPRHARFTTAVDGVSGTAEAVITAFPGDVGGPLANVNRWRRQLGMAPVADIAEQPSTPVETATGTGDLYDLLGPEVEGGRQRMLVASLAHAGRTWFIKMVGPDDVVQRERDALLDLLGSLRFAPAHP